MEELQRFDIVFYKGDSFISKMIKHFTKSEYSHMALVLDEFHLIETDYKFPVGVKHFSYNYSSYDVFRCPYLTIQQEEEMLLFLKNELQHKYDWIHLATRWLHILFNTKIIDVKKRRNCDEIIFAAFKHVGIELSSSQLITAEKISKSPYLIKVK